MQLEITIGWTMSDRASGYSSFDGYAPGARQHRETITVDLAGLRPTGIAAAGPTLEAVEQIAEAAFVALNAPSTLEGSLARAIAEAVHATGYRGIVEGAAGHYSLSVGDTVTVGEVTLACSRVGWTRVTVEPAL